MPDYDLSRLGSRAFEQLIVSLARCELGPAMQVFGDGPDGGREAVFDGTITWSGSSSGLSAAVESWNGYTVIQAKFQVKPKRSPHDDAVWLQNEISREIDGWIDAAEKHTRTRLPDYLIFVTNVNLSAVARTGGLDVLTTFVRNKLSSLDTTTTSLRVKDFAIWHADQIRSMIDAHQDVRWAYLGLLTVGDALAMLATGEGPIGTMGYEDPLRQELIRSVRLDRRVRLSQAGGPGDSILWLDEIAIDLPAHLDQDPRAVVNAVGHILHIGERNLRRKLPDRVVRPNLVVVGGPGQGKSTVSQLLAQAYRTALLSDMDLGPGAEAIVEGTRSALTRLGLSVPGNRRWPVRVDLAKYAESLGSGSEKSLLRWISEEIDKRTDQKISPAQLGQWLRAWPWALILDGLDEVPVVEMRRTLYEAIDALLATADDCDADLLLVVTTRPIGYDEQFPQATFEHVYLRRLPTQDAVNYAQSIVAKRFGEDPEMCRNVTQRLREASQDPVTARLMETPLQVMIMSFVVEKYPNLPPDRFTLFDFYYTTVYDREGAKDIPIARFLIENRGRVDRLHEEVALSLQVESETAEGAEASMSPQALRRVARRQLEQRGFPAEAAEKAARQLEIAATTRLVLLTPREAGVGFEVRSLQEYMAARALAEGTDADVIERLRTIAHSPHWRNTWLLAAGKLLKSERFEKHLNKLLGDVDNDPRRLGRCYPTGPLLAADMLGDNLAFRRPGFEAALVARLLSILEQPPVIGVQLAARAMLDAAAAPHHRRRIYDRLGSVATAGLARRAAAGHLLATMRTLTRNNGALANIRIAERRIKLTETEERAVAEWDAASRNILVMPSKPGMQRIELATYLSELASRAGYPPPLPRGLRDALTALSEAEVERVHEGETEVCIPVKAFVGDPHVLITRLSDIDFAAALSDLLTSLPDSHWVIAALVGWFLKPALDRLPVRAEVANLFDEAKMSEADVNSDW